MRLALRELRRRPGRFAVATVILTLIALLLMFLGGLLDGLLGSATGAYRAQRGDLVVYSADARHSLVRSRITGDQRLQVGKVDGVAETGGLGSVQLGARLSTDPTSRRLISTALFGYELAPRGLPATPPAGDLVIADSSLRSRGVRKGSTLLLGPQRTPVEVVGFVDDTQYSGQGTLWGSLTTWREVLAANRPSQRLGAGVVQALVVRTQGRSARAVADDIDAATGGATDTLTIAAATDALPGVSQQRTTFNEIIGITVVVAVVVIALFFALITVERTALYGILKAIGASSGTLFAGVVAQAVVVTLIASIVAGSAALILAAAIPPGSIPFEVTITRLATSVILLLLAAVAGCAFSLRRVLRIDPAAAIGTAS
jgi:putative ABC transport system permease protein